MDNTLPLQQCNVLCTFMLH